MEIRRKRLIFRAWHRGMRELDLILGSYGDQKIMQMEEAQLNQFEKILDYEDSDLIGWLSGQVAVPPEFDEPMLRDIMNHPVNS